MEHALYAQHIDPIMAPLLPICANKIARYMGGKRIAQHAQRLLQHLFPRQIPRLPIDLFHGRGNGKRRKRLLVRVHAPVPVLACAIANQFPTFRADIQVFLGKSHPICEKFHAPRPVKMRFHITIPFSLYFSAYLSLQRSHHNALDEIFLHKGIYAQNGRCCDDDQGVF